MASTRPAVLIGLDAAEIDVIERLLEEGRLPNLAALRRRGRSGRLETRPNAFLSMVWPTFSNGTGLGRHGWYFNKQWRPEHQRLEYTTGDWLPQEPAWNDLAAGGLRLGLFDIPFSDAPPPGLDGVYVGGWQCHDDFGRHVAPKDTWRTLVGRFGPPAMKPEFFGVQDGASLLRQRREALDSLEQTGKIAAHLLRESPFDLFMVVFGGVHRAGHYLWDLSQIDADRLSVEDQRTLEGANDDLYVAADEALGRVLDAVTPDARVLVFALHGMTANDGWPEHFPRLLGQVHAGGPTGAEPKAGLVYRLKQALPWKAVRQVTTRLPSRINHRLVALWSARMHDWASTRYFALPIDFSGYVRANVRGRDAEGIVDPNDLAAVHAELQEAFTGFRDLDQGQQVVQGVERIDDLVGVDATRRRLLPDFAIRWGKVPATGTTGVRSPKLGEIRWPKGARLFSGRSGNHTPNGWYVAAGPDIEHGVSTGSRDSRDVMPTLFRWLGQPVPERFEGQPIEDLLGDPVSSAQPERRRASG
jgi:predicted AlkP superfamily phosphohydrolase/phosphomutase